MFFKENILLKIDIIIVPSFGSFLTAIDNTNKTIIHYRIDTHFQISHRVTPMSIQPLEILVGSDIFTPKLKPHLVFSFIRPPTRPGGQYFYFILTTPESPTYYVLTHCHSVATYLQTIKQLLLYSRYKAYVTKLQPFLN